MPHTLLIAVRGAGDLATGVVLRLHRAGFRRLVMLERDRPMAVRRGASFSEAVRLGSHAVEGVTARLAGSAAQALAFMEAGEVPVLVDPGASWLAALRPEVFVDAAMAKRNLGTSMDMAPLVIALGPGFFAGRDCHRVVETCRGPDLGRVIAAGPALPDTGVPGEVMGHTTQRVLRAPCDGFFEGGLAIGCMVSAGQRVGAVSGRPVTTGIDGVLRGLLPDGTQVRAGVKVGDVDPRGDARACFMASDKALAVGGGVLEAVLERYDNGRSPKEAWWPSANP